jgi:hypothetical protein
MKYKPSENLFSKIDGDSIILVTLDEENYYYEVEGTGRLLWNAIERKPLSKNELMELIQEEFEVDENQARKHLDNWLEELLDEKLLVIIDD